MREKLECLGVVGRALGVVCPFTWGACSILRVMEPGRLAMDSRVEGALLELERSVLNSRNSSRVLFKGFEARFTVSNFSQAQSSRLI